MRITMALQYEASYFMCQVSLCIWLTVMNSDTKMPSICNWVYFSKGTSVEFSGLASPTI